MNTVITEKFMPTKASIVQRLLDEKQITAEEAVILLQNEPRITTIPQPYPYMSPPMFPLSSSYPIYPTTPYVYCGTTGAKINTLNVK